MLEKKASQKNKPIQYYDFDTFFRLLVHFVDKKSANSYNVINKNSGRIKNVKTRNSLKIF